MPALDIIDHSPRQPDPSPPVSSASNLVLIDNYDSFTWNVYQYLVLEGATVTVYRNDEIGLNDLIAQEPTQIVISPGPGHPESDAGISKDAIRHFAGKIPILGVCMGEQCIFSVFGGKVDVTGEILHGKTSPLRHDSKGVYENLPQDLPVTRYHSLAGTHRTLPDCLEVSSWIALGPDGKEGVIMGVRHKELLVEGVQFHPESILTAEGRTMLKNFLKMQGGSWAENERIQRQKGVSKVDGINGRPEHPSGSKDKVTSILEKIYAHRRAAVADQEAIPSQRPADLEAAYALDLSPPLISFSERLRKSPYQLSLMAEIKRASPSKGIISLGTCAPTQARKYALGGASLISVLTEPEWFKGSIEDLRSVRAALEAMPNRPAVLRKEFIFDEYQILEARLAGADTVLLIVKMLDEELLTRLYKYSQSLGMEALVEVNTVEEMHVAVKLGSKVIGVNNRNLTNFEVDLETTSRLMSIVPEGTIVCALSGISGPKDVEAYLKNGVGAVLVGEALMRASDTSKFIADLLGGANDRARSARPERELMVKICGTRTPEAAQVAVEAGADLIGMILVPGTKRYVNEETALQISRVIRSTHKPSRPRIDSSASPESRDHSNHHAASDYFEHTTACYLRHSNDRASLVGVFQNQPLEEILHLQRKLSLDIVQLHGSEPLEWARLIPVPVIRSFKPGQAGLGRRGYHAVPLLDSGSGGTGQRLDTYAVRKTLQADEGLKIILAGGLGPRNVVDAIESLGVERRQLAGVDVSSGVETDGRQDLDKIRAFINAAKSIAV